MYPMLKDEQLPSVKDVQGLVNDDPEMTEAINLYIYNMAHAFSQTQKINARQCFLDRIDMLILRAEDDLRSI